MGGSSLWIKLTFGMLTALVVVGVVILVLFLDKPAVQVLQDDVLTDALASQRIIAVTPAPTHRPTATPVPTMQERINGVWMAMRVENNTKKSKELLTQSATGDFRTIIDFMPDGTAVIATDQMEGTGPEGAVRYWYVLGEDVYIDYGYEVVQEETYFGSTRFFLKDELLYSVYTLDGKEVSDFVVYGRLEAAEDPDAPPEDPSIIPIHEADSPDTSS